jgi:hypothetical protein
VGTRASSAAERSRLRRRTSGLRPQTTAAVEPSRFKCTLLTSCSYLRDLQVWLPNGRRRSARYVLEPSAASFWHRSTLQQRSLSQLTPQTARFFSARSGLAVARNFAPREARTYVFEKPDQQALTSLLSFLLGTSLGRIGDRWGCKRRGWLATSSVIQAVLLTAAAVLAHYSGEPSVALYGFSPSARLDIAPPPFKKQRR